MGFLRDLFGPARPCDVCQLGKRIWPKEHNAIADWKLRGHGLQVDLLICSRCRSTIAELGLMHSNPLATMASMATLGLIDRPPVSAYLWHHEWCKVAANALVAAGIETSSALSTLTEVLRSIEASVSQSTNPAQTDSYPQPRVRRTFCHFKVTWNVRVYGGRLWFECEGEVYSLADFDNVAEQIESLSDKDLTVLLRQAMHE